MLVHGIDQSHRTLTETQASLEDTTVAVAGGGQGTDTIATRIRRARVFGPIGPQHVERGECIWRRQPTASRLWMAVHPKIAASPLLDDQCTFGKYPKRFICSEWRSTITFL